MSNRAMSPVPSRASVARKRPSDVPPLVENGNTVPMTVNVFSPMTSEDYVKSIHVFNEKNPQPNVVSHAVGVAFANRHLGSAAVVWIAFGDGGLVALAEADRGRSRAGFGHRGGELVTAGHGLPGLCVVAAELVRGRAAQGPRPGLRRPARLRLRESAGTTAGALAGLHRSRA